MTREQDARQNIAAELYAALERLGADDELLAIVGGMRDTMTEKGSSAAARRIQQDGESVAQPEQATMAAPSKRTGG